MIEEFEDLGKEIAGSIQDAINSQDFRKIKNTVAESMDRAVREAKEGFSGKSQNGPSPKGPQKAQVITMVKNPPGAVMGMTFFVLGIVFTSCMAPLFLLFLMLGTSSVIPGPVGAFLEIFTGCLLAGSLIMLRAGMQIRGRCARFKKYRSLIGENTYYSIRELASAIGKKPRFVAKDLLNMIRLGMFPHGRLDEKKTCLMLTDEVYRQYIQAVESRKRRELEEKKAKKLKDEVVEPKAEKEENREEDLKEGDPSQAVIEEGKRCIRILKEANDRMPGEEISRKLDRLETIIARIFEHIESRPDKLPQIRRFNQYYLPTTVKLVQAYEELENQRIEGKNITQSKQEILETLDTIQTAFENLLDGLFEDTSMDISTDISVLETMLEQEGLTKSR